MAEKQPHLNGAYYGPAIPPPNQHYHRPGGHSGCGCGCCLLSLLLKLILTATVIIGLAVFVFWLIFRPSRIKFHVTDATLAEFNHTSGDNLLQYDLAMNITIRNPNKKIGVYYDTIEARAFYEDQSFGSVSLTPFYQGHKNTSVMSPVFKGQQVVLLDSQELTQYNQDMAAGIYNIEVKLYMRIRFKLGRFKTGKFKPKMECELKVPLNSSGKLAGTFQTTKCELDY